MQKRRRSLGVSDVKSRRCEEKRPDKLIRTPVSSSRHSRVSLPSHPRLPLPQHLLSQGNLSTTKGLAQWLSRDLDQQTIRSKKVSHLSILESKAVLRLRLKNKDLLIIEVARTMRVEMEEKRLGDGINSFPLPGKDFPILLSRHLFLLSLFLR